jgi:hypothetical protein
MHFIKNLQSGTYGHTSLFKYKDVVQIVKISNGSDFRTRHEYQIMKDLQFVDCINFCKPLFIKSAQVNNNYLLKGNGNPFKLGRHNTLTEICGMEYIRGNTCFEDIVSDFNKYNFNIIYSIIKQVLCAISIASQKIGFTHYDLHTDNIMIKKTKDDVAITYELEGGTFVIPTFGYIAIIIDFGFSFTNNVANVQTPIMFPQYGYTSNTCNNCIDGQVFLTSVLYELDKYRRHQLDEFKIFKNIVTNIYSPYKINMTNGWDLNITDVSYDDFVKRMDTISDKCDTIREDNLFIHHLNECMDILQYGINLPLESKANCNDDVKLCYTVLITEWGKIDSELESHFDKLTILKYIVECSVDVRNDAMGDMAKGCEIFKNKILNQKYFKFFYPKNVDYLKLLGSLYLFYDCLENILYADYKQCTSFKRCDISVDELVEILIHNKI